MSELIDNRAERVEVTQDVGPIRALEGERRLLEYTEPAVAGVQ